MSLEIGNLENAALKRREKLKNMRKKTLEGTSNSDDKCSEESLPMPVFRSYQPSDETLKDSVLPKAKPESVEEQVKDHLEAAKPAPLISEVENIFLIKGKCGPVPRNFGKDLTTLAPRKPDWDLKRDVAKKLEKLERRTQRAIAELIRERLKSSEENLAEAVNAVTETSTPLDDDDSDGE